MTPRAIGLALALALAAPRAAAGADVAVHREELPGGLELLVLPVGDSRSASLRYVVRAGSAHDPGGREGLAHLVEHLLFQRRPGETGILDAARLAGAKVNAFTSRDATVFLLDAPADAFPALAERYLRGLSNPPLDTANVDRELDVVRTEHDYKPGIAVVRLAEEAIFRTQAAEAGPIGEHRSRERIRREDAVAFYQANYVTSNTTLVFTGAVTPEVARAVVDRAFLLPPALPEERVTPRPGAPHLPIDEKLSAGFLASVFGYRLDDGDREACEPLAAAIELKLVDRLEVREPLLSDVDVGCVTLRGVPFLLATGFAPTLEASDLPLQMEEVFAEVARGGVSARERPLVTRRLQRARDRTAWEAPALADAVAAEAMRPRVGGETAFTLAPVKALPEAAMRAVARRCFVPERNVQLFLSPFQE